MFVSSFRLWIRSIQPTGLGTLMTLRYFLMLTGHCPADTRRMRWLASEKSSSHRRAIGVSYPDTAMFVSSDPIVHNRVFGLARFDLRDRQIDFNPIGPAPDGMAGIEVTPDKKWAYTVVANGLHGKKRCEFWAFELTPDRIAQRAEVPCRTRFTLGISTDGKKLYIYGAGSDIESVRRRDAQVREDLGPEYRRDLRRHRRYPVALTSTAAERKAIVDSLETSGGHGPPCLISRFGPSFRFPNFRKYR
jgi:hypothetical protein